MQIGQLVTVKYDRVSKSTKIYKFWGYFGQIGSFFEISKDGHHPWNIPKHDTKYQIDSVRGSR